MAPSERPEFHSPLDSQAKRQGTKDRDAKGMGAASGQMAGKAARHAQAMGKRRKR